MFGIAIFEGTTDAYSMLMSGCFMAVQPLLCYSMIKASRKLKGADRLMTALFVTSFVTIFAWMGYTILPDNRVGYGLHHLGNIFLNNMFVEDVSSYGYCDYY